MTANGALKLFDLSGRAAIVTGAGRGIGKAIAKILAEAGASVMICGRDAGRLQETARELSLAGARCIFEVCDITQANQVEGLVKKSLDTLGRLDILVNNAGVTRDNLIARMSEEDWQTVLSVNLKGTFLVTREVIRPMMKARFGRIVNVSSVIGLTGNAGQANYAASKAGIIAFTKSIAKELASRMITANAIAPGFIETDMTSQIDPSTRDAVRGRIALARFGSPEEVASVVLFLASDAARYITGQVISVDGGLAL